MPKKLPISGQSYLDIVITLGILTILTSAVYSLVATTYQTMNFSRARTTARHLAQHKMELIRNLSYSDVGTYEGIPPGILDQSETVFENGLDYTVKTSVVYVDDPFDGQAPADFVPNDYKRARVEVSWGGLAQSRNNPITLISDFAPNGVETTVGGGTLSILVFNSEAEPVGQASVSISAAGTNPPVNLTLETNSNGRIILPGSPICNSCYQITVTKTGYSTDRTYSISEVANPSKPYVTILEGLVSDVSFSIDRVSTLEINTLGDSEINYTPIPNFSFYLRGNKTIGTDINDEPVYKYRELVASSDVGVYTANNLEWDNYMVELTTDSSLDIAGTNPLLPYSLLPNSTVTLALALTPSSNHNLLVAYLDNSQAPIASVSSLLTNGLGYEASLSSGLADFPDFGQVFYSDLTNATYLLQATVSGYAPFSGNININGKEKETIILNNE